MATRVSFVRDTRAADLDGDGDVDAVSAAGLGVIWHRNNGDGTFTKTFLATGADLYSVVIEDLDHDGDLDVVAGGVSKVLWLENDGSQSFTRYDLSSATSLEVAVADLDGDGDQDILSAEAGAVWYRNDGSQTFASQRLNSASNAESVSTADVDRDGDLDVLVGNNWLENGNGWSAASVSSGGAGLVTLGADLDLDGDLDLLTSSYNDALQWHENDGHQGFTAHTLIAGGAAPAVFGLVVQDLDGDGDLDLITTSRNDDRVLILENDGAQNFSTHSVTDSLDGAWGLDLADMDGDGDLDAVVSATNRNSVSWFPLGMWIALVSDSAEVNGGEIATLGGGYDPLYGASFSATVGTVIDHGDGTFTWNYPTDDFSRSGVVDITADGGGVDLGASFDLDVVRSRLYVNGDAPDGGTGASWATAFNDLQDALAASHGAQEIWVAAGVYKPGEAEERDVAFTLKNGYRIYGGFAGGETGLDQRVLPSTATVLSGDVDGDDIDADNDGIVATHADQRGGNAQTVVGVATGATGVVLDGFTVTAGRADGSGQDASGLGGGLFAEQPADHPFDRRLRVQNGK